MSQLSVSVGDKVSQTGLIGLAPLPVSTFVVGATPQGIVLSREPNGPPLTDLRGQTRVYDPTKFRKDS